MSSRVFYHFLYCAIMALSPIIAKGGELDIDVSEAQIFVPGGQSGIVLQAMEELEKHLRMISG
ncbi:MAG: hypothetical protein IKJ37_14155, partial [Kiritimatiellae bacterium]|nr:hypothetical protein [Kiritimatiellia bacterium]